MRRSEFGRQALFISRHPGAKRLDILIRMDGIEGRTAASGGGAAAGETTFDRFSCRVTVCSESGQAPHDGFKLAALRELVHRIDADRLEQPKACNWTSNFQSDKRFRHETCQATHDVRGCHPVARCDRARGVDRKGAAQDGQPPHDRALSLGQQSVAPVERRPQRLLPRRRRAAAIREHTETLIELGRNGFYAERRCVRCRELDRQREAVQATAYPCRGRRCPRIELYAWLSRTCAQDKQLRSTVSQHFLRSEER